MLRPCFPTQSLVYTFRRSQHPACSLIWKQLFNLMSMRRDFGSVLFGHSIGPTPSICWFLVAHITRSIYAFLGTRILVPRIGESSVTVIGFMGSSVGLAVFAIGAVSGNQILANTCAGLLSMSGMVHSLFHFWDDFFHKELCFMNKFLHSHVPGFPVCSRYHIPQFR